MWLKEEGNNKFCHNEDSCSFMTKIGREGVSGCLGVGGCWRVCVRVYRRCLGSLVRFGCVRNLSP